MRTKLKTVQSHKQSLVQKVLQQQLQILRLKELLIMAGFIIGAAALRAGMQWLPSVEPITFFAVLAGWLFGKGKGFFVGASALYASNFLVFGGQGPWTVPQAIAFGLAGYLGGFISRRLHYIEAIGYMLGATVVFELIMNVYSGLFFGGNILLAFFTALPFIAVHTVSNLGFALLLPATGRVFKKGGFHEKGFLAGFARAIAGRAGGAGQPTEKH